MLEPAVIYPLVIAALALWYVFATRRDSNSGAAGLRSIFCGVGILVITFGVLLIEGLSAADALRVLIFENGDPWGKRRLAAVGYLFLIAGVILTLRSRFHGRRAASGHPEQ